MILVRWFESKKSLGSFERICIRKLSLSSANPRAVFLRGRGAGRVGADVASSAFRSANA